MITVCAELSLVHLDPIGDTVHSLDNPFSTCTGGPKHLMSDMKDTCCEVHLCVTSKTTECAETVLDKSDHSAGCAGCSHGSQDTAGSLIYLWEWQLLLGEHHLHSWFCLQHPKFPTSSWLSILRIVLKATAVPSGESDTDESALNATWDREGKLLRLQRFLIWQQSPPYI